MAESNNSESKTATAEQKPEDESKPEEDLDLLLDSALDDFTELAKEKPTTKKGEEVSTSSKEEEAEAMWTEMIKQALQVDPNIRDMFEQGSNGENTFVQDFTKIAEAAAKVMDDSPSDFANIMSEALRNLNQSSETIQLGNPEELANMFQDLGLNSGEQRPEDSIEGIPPFLQSIMQSFLSKEVLYPSMKDFVEKYPVWLEENKTKITAEQHENYSKQLELIKKVVEEFEAESESDSEDVKKQRFQRIMNNMQQMQMLGHPPADLIGSNFLLDESAMPDLLPGMDPNQCSTM